MVAVLVVLVIEQQLQVKLSISTALPFPLSRLG
jgi:hypothetical protein